MTRRTSKSLNMTMRGTLVKACLAVALTAPMATLVAGPAPARAAVHIDAFDFASTNADGTPSVQAGAHPYQVATMFQFPSHRDGRNRILPDESPRNLTVELPAGFVGDPTSVPTCSEPQLETGTCPVNSQIGVVGLITSGITIPFQLYNMKPPPGMPAEFGFLAAAAVAVHLQASVRTGGDYGVNITVKDLPQTLPWTGSVVTIWGVPADSSHNSSRGLCLYQGGDCPSQAPRAPFLTNPSACSPVANAVGHADSWQATGVFDTAQAVNHDAAGPVGIIGCERLPFKPTLTAHPTGYAAGSPAGFAVGLHVPQTDNPDGLAEATLKKAVVTLPAGVSVSPSSADGLGACSPAQIRLNDGTLPDCPDSSKIGTVDIDTPLLNDPLSGSIYLAQQGSNPFNSLLAIYLVASGDGVVVKLAGHVEPDPVTGQLKATFDNNPQLPFSDFTLTFSNGPRAALANPETCGTYTTTAELTPWGDGPTVTSTDSFTIDSSCAHGFAPSFDAGTVNPAGGATTSFTMNLARTDADDELSTVAMTMPPGLLGNLKDVTLCADGAANAGTCGTESRIGTTTVGSGPGVNPFHLGGGVYLTGPYKGAPFGLSIVVPALAGPFDLGTVVVRAALSVDPSTAAITVVADPLPTILQGIPLRLRDVNVTIDRPGFMFNPTNCAPSRVTGTIGSTSGATVAVASRFQAANCASLGYKPGLTMALSGRGQTTDGKHPALTAHLAPRANDANSRKVTAKLPLALALDPLNANGLCEPAEAAVDKCPAKSIVGTAKATSILHVPLSAPVYFVHGFRIDPKSKRQVATLPKLYIPLAGEGVRIDLNASSEVVDDRLVTTFDNLPDAPLRSFDLTIDGGRHGILAVSGTDICKGNQEADVELTGQNNKESDIVVGMATPCSLRIASSSHTAASLKLKVGGLGAGKVTVSGTGLRTTRRTIVTATVATVSVPFTAKAKAALARHRDVRVRAKVSFSAKGSKKAKTITKTLTVHG
ncbi:MAG TPA: hypothetical protein VFG42_00400 [Baekduia sp.]|uniref:hypothetical protein n=1 Tax=Baekduia sp. TaxID=2600305 RepID=UPI002D79DD13|nr:hypothetical protein [Baekduia sp.]HET6505219.1 hypothetical protein [Baekduia sp.]